MSDEKKQRENHVKSLRLLKLEKAIQSLHYPNVPKLMEVLEVSRRTVLRDLDELKDYYGAPIEYDKANRGYCYTDKTYFVGNVLLSQGELVAMAGILPLLERYDNTPLKETISRVYETISQMLPCQVQVQSSLLNQVQFISDPLPFIDSEIFTSLFQAIKEEKTINFDYRSIKSTDYTPHSIDPYKIYCQKGDWYVIGFCHQRNRFSTFNLSRIKDIVLTEKFEWESDYENKIHIDPNYGIWNNDLPSQKIELVFDKSINTYILERTWHKNQECHQDQDGSVYLSFESNQMQQVLYWVLGFGCQVQVLNPPELKERYQSEIKKMFERSCGQGNV